MVAKVEGSMTKANLALEEAIQVRDEANQSRDDAIARANSIESEQDRIVVEVRVVAQ